MPSNIGHFNHNNASKLFQQISLECLPTLYEKHWKPQTEAFMVSTIKYTLVPVGPGITMYIMSRIPTFRANCTRHLQGA